MVDMFREHIDKKYFVYQQANNALLFRDDLCAKMTGRRSCTLFGGIE